MSVLANGQTMPFTGAGIKATGSDVTAGSDGLFTFSSPVGLLRIGNRTGGLIYVNPNNDEASTSGTSPGCYEVVADGDWLTISGWAITKVAIHCASNATYNTNLFVYGLRS